MFETVDAQKAFLCFDEYPPQFSQKHDFCDGQWELDIICCGRQIYLQFCTQRVGGASGTSRVEPGNQSLLQVRLKDTSITPHFRSD